MSTLVAADKELAARPAYVSECEAYGAVPPSALLLVVAELPKVEAELSAFARMTE